MKRSRHTVTFDDGTRAVILAYAHQSDAIRAHYAKRGRYVARIQRGDLVNCPAPADGGWALDRANYSEAVAFYGLDWPVLVKQTAHRGGRYGAHQLRLGDDGRPYHHITMKSWLTAEQAGRVLWHELCHAMQAERAAAEAGAVAPRAQMNAWSACSARMGAYRSRPVEVEARTYEAYNAECPLARRR